MSRTVHERLRRHLIEKWMSRFDPLTGLYNRTYAKRDVEQRVKTGTVNAVVQLDLDGFKQINDTGGHAAGDKVLRHVGKVLQANTRDTDCAFRLGGDEFGLVFTDINPNVVADKLEMIRKDIEALHLGVTASIGYCIAEPTLTIEENFRRADEALYEAKDAGKNCIRAYRTSHQMAA